MASGSTGRKLFSGRFTRMPHEERSPGSHPVLRAAVADATARAVSRRDLIRLACLLGVSAPLAAATVLRLDGSPSAQAETTPVVGGGGALRVAMAVHPLGDPALAEWPEPSNVTRHQYEYLTITDADNITRPMLAEGWAASDDLRIWSFSLRAETRWRDGAPLTAEEVAWNLRRWLEPGAGSSNASLLGAGAEVEVVDSATLRLHLASPSLSVPESLYNYPAAILRPDFAGDALSDGGGTGAYRLVEHEAGRTARLLRDEPVGGYWGAAVGHIGPGLLDEIVYSHVDDTTEGVRAFTDGAVDVVHDVGVREGAEAASALGGRVLSRISAMTGCMRMRLDAPPFDDRRVRRAIQLCCDVGAYSEAVFDGRGGAGAHTHVAPIHPEYTGVAAPRRDVEAARRLLAEAGYGQGVDLQLLVADDRGGWRAQASRLLAEQARPAGVRIAVTTVTPDVYRQVWRSTPFGLTQWTHRPLGTMALALGYKSDAAWNETGFAEPAFDAALAEAEASLDIAARREAMARVERILQDAAVMAQPVWAPASMLVNERVNGLEPQPTQYHHFNHVRLAAA